MFGLGLAGERLARNESRSFEMTTGHWVCIGWQVETTSGTFSFEVVAPNGTAVASGGGPGASAVGGTMALVRTGNWTVLTRAEGWTGTVRLVVDNEL